MPLKQRKAANGCCQTQTKADRFCAVAAVREGNYRVTSLRDEGFGFKPGRLFQIAARCWQALRLSFTWVATRTIF